MSDIWDICSDINDSFEEKKKENKTKDNQPKEKERKCENCGSKNFMKYNNEKIICEDCNLVAENIIDYSQEWRYYGSNDKNGDIMVLMIINALLILIVVGLLQTLCLKNHH
jgi:ribosomal protein S27AE